MTTRHAACACGRLRLTCAGDPIRVSVCHCLACQQRTGSAFGAQARFRREQVLAMEGATTPFTRTGDGGTAITFHFCPACGSTVYWLIPTLPDFVVVAVGAFADPAFPSPTVSVYEARQHPWMAFTTADVEHLE
ncbi:MAG: GFA family protein [Deltaproteobacteria bacterium]|nr:GFA family protein [Myxococcales bacterium]MDP3220682.1 GFA family protein [Deltaproteobacteria bacterium]